ncbi:hypothetical protein MD484_g6766, partial [Candolleomyces efflorescens]
MFIRLSAPAFLTTFTLALTPLIAGSPAPLAARADTTCESGPLYCCNTQTMQAPPSGHPGIPSLPTMGGLGVITPTLGELAGARCDALAIGGTGTTCAHQTACCSNVDQHGFANIACKPTYILI